jgi:hypothetical protein
VKSSMQEHMNMQGRPSTVYAIIPAFGILVVRLSLPKAVAKTSALL